MIGNTTAFSGTYDGGGHTIRNTVNNNNEIRYYGLFSICESATFINCTTTGILQFTKLRSDVYDIRISPFVVKANNCLFIDCTNQANIMITAVGYMLGHEISIGGIVGNAVGCQFIKTQNKGEFNISVKGYSKEGDWTSYSIGTYLYIGGIVGYSYNSICRDVRNTCNLSATVGRSSSGSYIVGPCCGGIAGYMSTSELYNSYNIGNISVTIADEARVHYAFIIGGIIGSGNANKIEQCFYSGNLNVEHLGNGYPYVQGNIGGLIGNESSGHSLNACFSRTNIHSNREEMKIDISGIAWSVDSITNSYAAVLCDISSSNYSHYPLLYNRAIIINNAHYLLSSDIKNNSLGAVQTSEYMKSEDFVDLLNSNGNYFKMDTENTNDGYPILDCLSNYLLQVKANTGGIVKGSGNYQKNSQVTISAIPSESYAFTGWSDGSTENPRTITLLGDSTITASFRRTNYTIKVSQDCTITME